MNNMLLWLLYAILIGLFFGGYIKLAITEKYNRVRLIGFLTLPMFVIMFYPCYTYFKKEFKNEIKSKKTKFRRYKFSMAFVIVYLSSYNEFSFLLAEACLKALSVSVDSKVKVKTFRNAVQKEWYDEYDNAVVC